MLALGENMETRVCENCGKEFEPSKNDVRIKFCCENCRTEYRKKTGYMNGYYRVNKSKWTEKQGTPEYKAHKNEMRNLRYATDKEYRDKILERRKEYNRRKPETKLNSRMKKFGITWDEYQKMHDEQGGKCAICGTEIGDAMGNRLYVDHNHKTRKVRGLLCSDCNFGIGKFKDNTELLRKAIQYLEETDGADDNMVRP